MLSSNFEVRGSRNNFAYSAELMANRGRFFNTMNNYLTWCAIRPYINYASRPLRKAQNSLFKSLHGGQGQDERWKTCVTSTNSALGYHVMLRGLLTQF
jgi:predicted metalloendopeptidase